MGQRGSGGWQRCREKELMQGSGEVSVGRERRKNV